MAESTADGRGERGDWLRRSVILSAFLAVIGVSAGSVFWFQAVPDEALAGAGTTHAQTVVSGSTATTTTTTPTPRATAPAPTGPEPVHADVYFDFKSTRLRADAARLLQEKAALMTSGEPWTVLIQGHTDGQGDPVYNRMLAQRRADVVKQFLVELGVPETSIKAAALGADSALCDDPSAACQQVNRRVHLEFRRLLRTSEVLPVEPVRVHLAEADQFQAEGDEADTDHDCPGDADDAEGDWSSVSSFAK
jgi:outer membrane protein OmpA-like peptidoglycan-associated protein